jgi:hypothetical protein
LLCYKFSASDVFMGFALSPEGERGRLHEDKKKRIGNAKTMLKSRKLAAPRCNC